MTALQTWLAKPIANVCIDAAVPWKSWIGFLRHLSPCKPKSATPRLEVLDRLSLGGKKSLLLVSVEGRRLLVGVADGAAPSITQLGERQGFGRSRGKARAIHNPRARKMVGS